MQYKNRLFSGASAPHPAFSVSRFGLRAVLIAGMVLAQAVAVERMPIYNTERIIVQNATEARQVEVLADALDEILVRASGVSALPDHQVLREARRSPQDFLNRFSLGDSEETVPDAIGNPQPTYSLDLQFAESLIHDLLAEAGLPVWIPVRPQVLVLLAGPDGQRIDLLPDNPELIAVETARRQADYQGLPVLWPLLDLEDSLTLRTEDIWDGLATPMSQMASRYQADAVLGGYVGLEPSSGRWVGRWHLLFGDEQTSETHFGEDQASVVQAGVQMAARVFSDRYGLDVAGDNTHELEFSVLNLTNLRTHGAVREYLNNLLGSGNLQMLSLEGDVVRYRLTFAGNEEQWLDLLALEQRLQESPRIRGFGEARVLDLLWHE